jgi:hypothetical protein
VGLHKKDKVCNDNDKNFICLGIHSIDELNRPHQCHSYPAPGHLDVFCHFENASTTIDCITEKSQPSEWSHSGPFEIIARYSQD